MFYFIYLTFCSPWEKTLDQVSMELLDLLSPQEQIAACLLILLGK